MDKFDLTVLMIARNQAEALPTCLAHLELQNHPAAAFELLVVDVASTDNTSGVVERFAAGAPVSTRCLRQESANTVAARNLGIREARGRIILFLGVELLASPNLVELHLQGHETHGELSCIVGAIVAHPQLAADSFIPLRTVQTDRRLEHNQALHFLDWRGQNMSLNRRTLLEYGMFDEEFHFPYFADAELAWRLSLKGVRGHYVPQAHAYLWRSSSLEQERQRHYARGYSLYTLARKTKAPEVLRRYSPERSPLAHWLSRITAGPSASLCQMLDQETRLFKDVYDHLLKYDFQQGYNDAHSGRAPRIPAS